MWSHIRKQLNYFAVVNQIGLSWQHVAQKRHLLVVTVALGRRDRPSPSRVVTLFGFLTVKKNEPIHATLQLLYYSRFKIVDYTL